jgi:sarcosine oxidase subunit gamma
VTADPLRRTALASLGEVLRRVDAREAHLQTQVSVRVAAELATGLELPTEPNTWSRVGAREALWLGPDEWLVVSDMEPADAAVRDLRSRVAGHHASIVDVSAGRAVIELAGDGRLDVLSAGCGLDLYPRSWRPGMCAQTLLARVTVLVQERDNATRVFLRPSYAGYFVPWLAEVTGEE